MNIFSKAPIKFLVRIFTAIFLASTFIGVAGCDEQRQQVADIISTPKPAELAARVDASVAENKATAGIAVGEAYLASHKDPEGIVHKAIAMAYLSIGDASAAQKHLELSATPSTTAVLIKSTPATASEPESPTAPSEPTSPDSPTLPTAPSPGNPAMVITSDTSITHSSSRTVIQSGSSTVTNAK